jgi:macrolide-specific efflux system membrane fusion protein
MKSLFAKKWLGITVVVLVIGAIFVGKQFLAKKTPAVQYQTEQVQRGTVISTITGSGQVATTNSTSITTEASGVVSKLYVSEGQTVKAGTAIAKLDLDLVAKQKAQQALSSYQSAKNQLAAAEANLYSLQSKLFAANQKFMNGAVVQGLANTDPNYIQQDADWLASEATYKAQQAVINQARTSVSQTWLSYQQSSDTIYAPITGTITGLSLQPGQVIAQSQGSSTTTATTSNSQGTKVANIITVAFPTIKVNLTEIDIPKIKSEQKATITLDALPDKTFVGKVISIDTVGQISSGVTTYPITIQLEDENPNILSNMAATANIIIDTRADVLVVANSAIQRQGDQTSVRVMKNGKVDTVSVEVGLSSDTQTEITSGLSEGDTVVTSSTAPRSTPSSTGTSPFSRSFGGGGGGAVRLGR